MSTATETAPAPAAESQTFIKRVSSLPAVQDAATAVHNAIQSSPYASAAYDKANGVATTLYKATEPLQQRLPLATLDSYANKGLDIVEGHFPIVKSPTSDIVNGIRKPADDAIGVARTYAGAAQSRISPYTEQLHAHLSQASVTLQGLQDRLAAAVAAVPRSTEDAQKSAQALQEKAIAASSSLVAEVEKLRDSLAKSAAEVPQHVASALTPLLEHLKKGATDIRVELVKEETPIVTKAQNILNYSKDQAQPLLQETIDALKALVNTAKKEASETPAVNGTS